MAKFDRALIATALIILMLTLYGLNSVDDWFFNAHLGRHREVIGHIVNRSGDVRVKYADDIRWQRGNTKQHLAFDDSIYSGNQSKVDVMIGESQLQLEQNTMIVLRRDQFFNAIGLDFGVLNGVLAKSDNLVVESGGQRARSSVRTSNWKKPTVKPRFA